jgi:SAM-dependent methyltransferase
VVPSAAGSTAAAVARRVRAVQYDYEARDKELVPACNLCGGRHLVEVSRVDRYGFPAVLRVCARCGLGFLSPRLTAAEYADFYAGVYRPLVSAYHGRPIDADSVQAEQREYAEALADHLGAALDARPRSIMDIGGSTGAVAGPLADRFGAAATVLDPAPDELRVAAAAGMETIAGFAEDYDPAGRTWDLVLLCQTIEHLLDVGATLAAIRGMLAPEGRAFADVLDVEFMIRRRGAVEGAVKIDHPFSLTPATARGFFAREGLAVVSERMADDGHWGFVLAPSEPAEPAWDELEAGARRLLDRAWALRAESP